MADSDFGGEISFDRRLEVLKNPPPVELPDMPTFVGITAKAKMERDGSISVSLTASASYGTPSREVSVSEEVDLMDTRVDEALRELVEAHGQRMARKAIRAGIRAWETAIRNKEMDE